MKSLCAVFVVLFLCAESPALTPAEAEASAALALSAAVSPARAKSKCTGDCKCPQHFGACHCEPGKCPCCLKSNPTDVPCVCGDSCKCESGKCPACPTAQPKQADTIRTLSGRVIRQTATGWVYADEGPVAAPAPLTGFPSAGGCVGGSCGRR